MPFNHIDNAIGDTFCKKKFQLIKNLSKERDKLHI